MMLSNTPRPAMLYTERRTGGTFLSVCLSSHPDIAWTRGEPLHHDSMWTRIVPDEMQRLQLITGQLGYEVAGFKLFRDHYSRPAVLRWVEQVKPLIIYLRREDYVSQAISIVANRIYRETGTGIPTHPMEALNPVRIELDAEEVVYEVKRLEARYGITGDGSESNQAILRAAGLRVLSLSYEDITGGANEAEYLDDTSMHQVCSFLGVRPMPLWGGGLRRAHHRPWGEYVLNWGEVRAAIASCVDLAGFPAIADGGKRES